VRTPPRTRGAPEADNSLAGLASTEDYVIDEHVNYMFEVETELVAPLMPAPLSPKEPRPGTALVNVGYMRFDGRQIGASSETIELTLSIVVQPDLTLEMQIPRMSVFDLRIASNCPVFLAHEAEHQKLPGVFLPGLDRILRGPGDLEVWDDCGPILRFRNPCSDPIYRLEQATGQYFTLDDEGLHQGVFCWEGVGCEQQATGDCGRLHAHRFYEGIDPAWIGDCFLQMFLPAGGQALFRSFQTRRRR
jgi:hypothetical protein